MRGMRPVAALPKAHLHLHFTGSMRHATLVELARRDEIRLPTALVENWPPQLSASDEKGWFRFQRLYDTARAVLRTDDDIRRLVMEAAIEDAADGAVWTEIQVDPSGYAAQFDGITAFTNLVLDAVEDACDATGIQMGVVIAANRTRHPLDARTLARLAAKYTDRGVIGFGLSNDERRGDTTSFAQAFRIARNAGLIAVPHGGELRGPAHISQCLDQLQPVRLGHGVRAAEDPALLQRIVDEDVTLEVCPSSNVALGVYPSIADVPVRTLIAAGARISLGSDDPLLFGSGLADQYEALRTYQRFSDAELAHVAKMSLYSAQMPQQLRRDALQRVDGWLESAAD